MLSSFNITNSLPTSKVNIPAKPLHNHHIVSVHFRGAIENVIFVNLIFDIIFIDILNILIFIIYRNVGYKHDTIEGMTMI